MSQIETPVQYVTVVQVQILQDITGRVGVAVNGSRVQNLDQQGRELPQPINLPMAMYEVLGVLIQGLSAMNPNVKEMEERLHAAASPILVAP